GLQTSNVCTTVRGLVSQGLLRREPAPHDRRAVQLYPTMGAIQGMARIEQAWSEIFADALAALSRDERTALTGAAPALGSLATALRERRGGHGQS
ncbi:MarR family winged helix-turn-helix transcriptional regulator, partial [Streptomyces albidoflavus]